MVMCVQGGSVPAIVQRQLGGLLPALQSGEEAGTLHARRLTTALQARPSLLSTSSNNNFNYTVDRQHDKSGSADMKMIMATLLSCLGKR